MIHYKQRLNYRIYRWIWVNSGHLSRWAGKKLIHICKDWDQKAWEEEEQKCQH